ncbi:isochorismatase family protein [Streptomyces lichenis]|uniref:Cysteine hydrolase n=1 Tax=Streptomyces lichenis TaxID=2306967 RepID=A0ABT0IAB9_9ACTN|nr:isochorismatase family protein [Streptomyces lichenis]MCK8678263.1 cysteine hydrolase [Streptomyces lichenis]
MGPPTAAPHPLSGEDGTPPPEAVRLPEPGRAALVLLGLNQGPAAVLPEPAAAELLAAVGPLRERAAARGLLVVHGVRHGPKAPRTAAGAAPAPRVGEHLVDHLHPNAFLGSRLGRVLRAAGRDQVVLCGLPAEHTVLLTAADAVMHGLTVFIASDAVADLTPERQAGALKWAARHGVAVLPAAELLPGPVESGHPGDGPPPANAPVAGGPYPADGAVPAV